jgi:murein endopeptidase
MRRPLSISALAVLASAVCLARAAPPADRPGPSQELLDTACSSGLLLQPAGADPAKGGSEEAATDDGGSIFGDAGLFGASETGGDEGEKGEKDDKTGAAPAKKKSKPKTKLLRPRSDKDKADCPAKVSAFYKDHGSQFSAVPAPADLSAAQIEGNIDRLYTATFGTAKAQLMSDLKGGDLQKKADAVNKIFDGAGDNPLDAALPPAKPGETPKTPQGLPAEAKPAAIEPGPQAPNTVLSPRARELYRAKPIPDTSGSQWTPGYAPPAPGTYEPSPAPGQPAQRPSAASVWNRYAPNFAQDLAVGAGSWAADKIWGGGNPAVNTMLPPDSHSPEQYRRVRYGNYGTEAMIKGIVATAADMAQLHAPPLQIGDISQKGGGTFRQHLSHKVGKDVDIFFITDSKGKFDVPWNLALAAAAVRNMNVTHIFVDTPLKNYMTQYLAQNKDLPAKERSAMAQALSRMSYWPGHDTHFHIRIDY